MTKFTKGEWTLTKISDVTYIDDDQGFSIAQVYDSEGIIENAPLLRSAKDMYAMLEDVSKLRDGDWSQAGDWLLDNTDDLIELLKKARGE